MSRVDSVKIAVMKAQLPLAGSSVASDAFFPFPDGLEEAGKAGATAVIQCARPGRSSPWLLNLLARKPKKLVAVALANKIARIAWVLMTRGEDYRHSLAA